MPSHHQEFAPPRIAWARRLILLGVLALAADYILYDWADIYGPLLADRVDAAGDLRVGGLDDAQIRAAFERARAANPADAVLIPIDVDHQGGRYEVHVTAPGRDPALEQMKALVAGLAAECTAAGGHVLWTSTNASPHLQMAPAAGLWLRRVKLALLLSGIVLAAAGGILYLRPRFLRLPA